jgi:small subunit ribosomal protein S15
MYLTKEIKEEIFAKHGENKHWKIEAQIALFTYRISHLTEHLKKIVMIITQSAH